MVAKIINAFVILAEYAATYTCSITLGFQINVQKNLTKGKKDYKMSNEPNKLDTHG